MADNEKKKKKSGISSNSNNNYTGPDGIIIQRAGYDRNAERYRERVRRERGSSQSFPNRRRKIVTGKDLTTPLIGKARVIEKHKRVRFGIYIEHLPKEKLPWGFIFKIVAGGVALCCLILSYIVLFEADYRINTTANMIRAAHIETNVLDRQLELENDSAEILRVARENYGMVEERYIQKKFISSRSENRAVVAEKNNGFLPEIIAGIFTGFRRGE